MGFTLDGLDKNENTQKYRTSKQQVELLHSRGLNFEDKKIAEKIFEKINYYNLINPYGKPFLLEKDRYIKEAMFGQIYNFYKFDKELSSLFLSYILYIESSFKTAISHIISSKGGNGHKEESYLDISIFSEKGKERSDKELEDDQKLLNDLKNTISASNKLYIRHNRRKYRNVPFWVLCNEMDFGETIYYYEKLPEKDRNKVSLKMRDENSEVKLHLGQFKSSLYMLKDLRNLIAHNEVFYWFKPTRKNGQSRWYGFNEYKEVMSQEGSIASVILIFNMYLSPDNWNSFYSKFEKQFKDFSEKTPRNIIPKILNDMGFYKMLNKEYKKDIISIDDIYKFYN